MSKQTPEQAAKAAHDSKELIFSPFLSGTVKHERYVDELLRLSTKAGKKR